MATTDAPSTPTVPDGVEVVLSPTERIRSPGDVLRLLAGLVVLGVGLALALFADNTLGGAEADLAEQLSQLPSRWEQVLLSVAELLVATTAVAVGGWLVVTRRFALFAWAALTTGAAAGLTFAVGWLLAGNEVEVLRGADSRTEWLLADPSFPSSGLIAAVTAGVVFASPWLTSRWRRTGWIALGVLVVLRVGLSTDPSADLVAAIGVGIVVGSAVLWWRGAPSVEPDGAELVAALRRGGVEPHRIHQIAPGHTTLTYLIDTDEDRTVRMGLRTQHDRSADALTHLWQTVRLRPDIVDEPFNSIRQRVEHEALALTLAARSGARVPELVAVVGTDDGSMGIVEDQIDTTPGAAMPEVPGRALLVDMWDQVRRLHAHHIAHRDLGTRQFCVDRDGRAWLTGFRRARLVATARERRGDVAQLLTDTAARTDAATAVDAAVEAIGAEATAEAAPLLQPLALPGATRRAVKAKGGLLDELRVAIEERTGVEAAPLERIERVRPRTVLTVVALTFAFYLVLPQLADIRSTTDAFVQADWAYAPWIVVGSALTYLFAAVAFVGAVRDPVPFAPALRAQIAAGFMALVAPASSGRLALGVRFLQRNGIDSAAAAGSVGLNAAAGLVAHLALTLVFVLWNGTSGLGSFSLPDATIVLGVFAAVLVVAGLLMLHRGIRTRVLGPGLDALRTAAGSIGGVFSHPVRVAQLFGGSIGITVAYLIAMVAAVAAFGGGPSVTQVAVGYLVVAALASFAPTPGGLGAFEAAMITALTGFGMSSGAAVSATLAFRLATYWLPVIPGWICFVWMQRNEEI